MIHVMKQEMKLDAYKLTFHGRNIPFVSLPIIILFVTMFLNIISETRISPVVSWLKLAFPL